MKRTLVPFGRQFGIFSLMFFLVGASVAQNCGGKDRWGPKDGTDPQARNIDLTNVTTKAVTNLVTIHEPQLPGDDSTRIVPDENERLSGAGAIDQMEARNERR